MRRFKLSLTGEESLIGLTAKISYGHESARGKHERKRMDIKDERGAVPVSCIAWLGFNDTPATPRVRRALSAAMRHAKRKKLNFVGMEHLLLGLLDVEDGTHVEWLRRMGLDPAGMRGKALSEYEAMNPEQSSNAEIAAKLRKMADDLTA